MRIKICKVDFGANDSPERRAHLEKLGIRYGYILHGKQHWWSKWYTLTHSTPPFTPVTFVTRAEAEAFVGTVLSKGSIPKV